MNYQLAWLGFGCRIMGRASEEGITGDFNIMLRLFYLAAVSVALNLIMTKVAFSRPISASSQYPEVQNSDVDVPLCYLQTADGRTLDLQKLCGNSPTSNSPSNSISPASNSLSNRISVPIFRRGAGNAYAPDSR